MTVTAKVFTTGRSQAVRLPKAFRFASSEVFIHQEGDKVILSEKPESWDMFFADKQGPTADFMEDVTDLPVQERDLF